MQESGLPLQISDSQLQLAVPNLMDFSLKSNKKIIRRKFCADEDNILKNLVACFGSSDWGIIASHFPNRTARQCHDRWKHYLSPEVVVGNWSEEEDKLLFEKYKIYGAQWSVIAKFFQGRTDIGVKNHYISLTTKKSKDINSKVNQHAVLLPNHIVFDSKDNSTNLNGNSFNEQYDAKNPNRSIEDLNTEHDLEKSTNLFASDDMNNFHQSIFNQIHDHDKNLSPGEKQQNKNSRHEQIYNIDDDQLSIIYSYANLVNTKAELLKKDHS